MTAIYHEYLDVSGNFLSYEDFNKHFRIRVPAGFNFAFDVADELARREPSRVCVVWENERGLKKRLTFGELKAQSDAAARFFASLGIGKGDRVMLVLQRDLWFWPVMMALHKLGAIAVPATHLLTEKDVRYRVEAAGIRAIITLAACGNIVAAARNVRKACPCLRTLLVAGAGAGGASANGAGVPLPEGFLPLEEGVAAHAGAFPRPENAAGGGDPLLLYFTSGTTGMPKMVVHDHTYPLAHITTAVYWQQVREGGLHLTISETGWAKSVWGKLYGQWLGGSAVMVYDFGRFVPRDILRVIAENRVTTFCAPPTMYRYLLQEDFAPYDLSCVKAYAVAGEPLSPDMAEEMERRTGVALREGFGQTELAVALANFPWVKVCKGSMGKPNPLYDIDIVDEDGASLPAGVTGEIVVRTHHGRPLGMFCGYFDDAERTRSVWHDDLYHTGDVAWRDEWGYYWYVGRADDVIKSSGYRIGPFEVESALAEHPAVLETAITAAPDPLRGQVVKATIVLKAGYAPSDALRKELQEHVKHTTAPYKYPRIIEFVDELPKTISGKIRRVELREKDGKRG